MSTNRGRCWPYYVPPLILATLLSGMVHYLIWQRIPYPYVLEWIEGGSLQVVVRILDGHPVYSPPDMDYVAPLYMPLYFYISAFFAALLGENFSSLRLVSYLASLSASAIVGVTVGKLTGSRWAAMLAFLCWGLLFKLSGSWFDVARVDGLWSCLLVACFCALAVFSVTRRSAWLYIFGFAYAMAVLTKQTSLVLAPFFLIALLLWANPRQLIKAALSGVVPLLLVGGLLQWHSDGLFFYYTMQMVGTHRFNPGWPVNFLYGDLFFSMPVLLLLALVYCQLQWRRRRDFFAWGSVLLGFTLMSLLGRWYSGGYVNVLMPWHQLLVLMGICGFASLVQKAKGVWSRLILSFVTLLLSLNIVHGYVSPHSQLPSDADRACGDKLVERLRQTEGGACAPRNSYLAFLAGKDFCAHEAFAVDVMNGSDPDIANSLVTDIRQRLQDGSFSVLLLDNQAQFEGYGISRFDLPYTATDLEGCEADSFYPVLQGQRPRHWLQYNGTGWQDLRKAQ